MITASLICFQKNIKQYLKDKWLTMSMNLKAPAVVKEAMIYSLEAGGKRIRPMLVFAVLSAFGKDLKRDSGCRCH